MVVVRLTTKPTSADAATAAAASQLRRLRVKSTVPAMTSALTIKAMYIQNR
jgi:hypothetical protein